MNDLQKRIALFLGFCITSRFLLAYLLYKLSNEYLRIIGVILLIPVIGWIYIYLTKSRQTGAETFGSPIWWNNIRPVHAGLYLIASLFAINKNHNAWKFITLDTTIGLLAFIRYHFF